MKVKSYNYSKGKIGEEIAKKYLLEKGYGYLDSNFKVDIGEIDLIMTDENWLVFVEVKYKSDNHKGYPEEMIDLRKILQVKRVAQIYLMKNNLLVNKYKKYRIDAVCILRNYIKHYINIYA